MPVTAKPSHPSRFRTAGVALLAAASLSCTRLELPPRENHPLPPGAEISECEPGRYGGIFVETSATEPNSFNPLVIEDATSGEIAGRFLSSLFSEHPVTREPIGGLAEKWDWSADTLSITATLRKGLRWSDGHPITTRDVDFTFRAIFDEKVQNRYSQQLTVGGEPIRWEILDERTIRFTSKEPYAPLLTDLGFVAILPEHVLGDALAKGELQNRWSVETGINRPSELIASGPFKLLSYRPGDRLIMVPNPHYWRADRSGQRLPYLDTYILKFVKDRNADVIHFATGQSDQTEISATDVAWVERSKQTYGFDVHDQGPDTSISFIWFNLRPGNGPSGKPFLAPHKLAWFSDRRFRQAVSYGFDRAALIRGVYFGRAAELHSIISEGNFRWHNPDVPKFPHDPDKARALLSEAGFQRDGDTLRDAAGNAVEFEILAASASATAPHIITSFSEDMRKLGIRVKVSYLDFGTLIARSSQTFEYEAAMMGFTGGGDPSGGKAIFMSDGRLHIWNPEQPEPATEWEARVDDLMRRQAREFEYPARKKLVDEMQVIFAEERPLIFLVTPNAYLGLKTRWQNTLKDLRGRTILPLDEIWDAAASPELPQ